MLFIYLSLIDYCLSLSLAVNFVSDAANTFNSSIMECNDMLLTSS